MKYFVLGLLLLSAGGAIARTAGYPLTLDFWLQNTVIRKATIYQCQRRGPGDQLVFIYCGIASKAELITLQRQTAQQQQWHR